LCEADESVRLGFEDHPEPQAGFMSEVAAVFASVDTASVARATAVKSSIAEEITLARINRVKEWLRTNTG